MYVWISEVMQEGDGVVVFASALPYLVIKSDIVIFYLSAKNIICVLLILCEFLVLPKSVLNKPYIYGVRA